jgi:hypothetical protein
MNHTVPREGRIRGEHSFATRAEELEIDVLQDAGMPEDGPTHRCRHEASNCFPFALLEAIGQT